MNLSYNWLKEYVPTLPKPEKLAELLTFHVAEVERIEAVNFSTGSKNKDYVLSMDVLPNRAHDLNSHLGVAKEIAALTGAEFTPPVPPLTKGRRGGVTEKKKKTADILSVRIEDASGCPRYIGRYIEGVKIGPSPKWMQERLEAVGMRPINNVVDATNFVMLEFGQPLHVFDANQIANKPEDNPTKPPLAKGRIKEGLQKEIIVRKAKKGEKFTTLDDQVFTLDGSELLIADNEKALALAGIKGGKKAGITSKTKNLILEAANFDPVRIRRTSEKLGIRTDSSRQFSGGLHPVLAERTMEYLASLIQQLAGGVMYAGAVDAYPRKWPMVRILFNPTACNTILGTSLKETEMKKMLVSLGCGVMSPSGLARGSGILDSRLRGNDKRGKWLVSVPQERLDLATSEDLYEEMGRLYGWDKIPASPAQAHLAPGSEDPMYALSELSRKTLCGMGYSEHVGYSLAGEGTVKLLAKAGYAPVELQNPLNVDTKYLRPMVLVSLLKAVAENAKRRDAVRLYELGDEFWQDDKGPVEFPTLGVLIYFKKEPKKNETWYEMKGIMEEFFRAHGLAVSVAPMPDGHKERLRQIFDPLTLAAFTIGDEMIGGIGIVEKRPKDLFDLEGMVVYAGVSLGALLKMEMREREFSEIPKFPAIARDIAVLVPKGTKVETVQNIIEREGGELLYDTDLFDIYEGKGVGDDEESLAFHLIFQSAQRTLKDSEVNELMKKVVEGLKKEDWEIRE